MVLWLELSPVLSRPVGCVNYNTGTVQYQDGSGQTVQNSALRKSKFPCRKKCKFCTQKLQQMAQNSALRKWKFFANQNFHHVHGKSAFPKFSTPNHAIPPCHAKVEILHKILWLRSPGGSVGSLCVSLWRMCEHCVMLCTCNKTLWLAWCDSFVLFH